MKQQLLACFIFIFSQNSFSQNVGIGTTLPLQKLDVRGASLLANNTNININNYSNSIMAGRLVDPSLTLENGIAGKQTVNGSTWSIGGAVGDFFIGVGNNSTANSQQIGLQIKHDRNVLIAPVSGNVAIGGGGSTPGSSLTVYGSMSLPVRYTDVNTILTETDHTLFCDLLNNDQTKLLVVLPAATPMNQGREYKIVALNAPSIPGSNLVNSIGGYVKISGDMVSLVREMTGYFPHQLFERYDGSSTFGLGFSSQRSWVTYVSFNSKWYKSAEGYDFDSW